MICKFGGENVLRKGKTSLEFCMKLSRLEKTFYTQNHIDFILRSTLVQRKGEMRSENLKFAQKTFF